MRTAQLTQLREQNKQLREFFVSLVRSKLLAHSPRNHPVQLWNQSTKISTATL